jgi:hypothetical protein
MGSRIVRARELFYVQIKAARQKRQRIRHNPNNNADRSGL